MRGSAALRASVAPGGALAGPWVRDPLWTRARAVPSLDLRFADNKSLVDATTGAQLVTFTRASGGTFVGSDGVLRSATTNLQTWSEDFSNAAWSKLETTVTTDATVAPNGASTADQLTPSTVSAGHTFSRLGGIASAGTFTDSVYAKANGYSFLVSTADSGGFVIYDISNGTITTSSVATGVVTAVGNGWYRCATTRTTSGAATLQYQIRPATSTFSYTGDGTSGIYLWGAQLEQSSTVGEYIPTTSTINSAPRFDHNPTTGESLGLLVEEARTNLLTYSEQFNDAAWSASGASITANAVTAPDGTITADKIVEDSANSNHWVFRNPSFTSGTTYVASVFAKAAERTQVHVQVGGTSAFGGLTFAIFDLTTQSVVSSGNSPVTSITSHGNGWYRLTVSKAATATASPQLQIGVASGNANSYTGDGTSGIYLWGAQLEAGAFPTSYIPTTTTAVTRSADVASISGSNFSSWYRQDEGTIYAEGGPSVSTINKTQLLATVNDNSSNNRWYVGKKFDSTTVAEFGVASGGAGQAFILSTPSSIVNAKYAAAYRVDSFGFIASGGALGVDTSGIVPSGIDRLLIGTLDSASNNINGTIRRLTYWPTRLPDSTLQAVTQ
jgi:hypothetical protein